MAMSPPVAETKSIPRPTLIPPEEKFWKRYSPHQEAPLSGVSSAVLHVLVLGLMLGIMSLNDLINNEDDNRPVQWEPVRLAGGGGSQTGSGSGDGTKDGQDDPQERGDEDTPPKEPPPLPQHEKLPAPQLEKVAKDFQDDPNGQYLIQVPTDNFNKLGMLGDEAREVLKKAVNPRPGKGQGGAGKDGGKDSGNDKGNDKFKGEGTSRQATLDQRTKRVLRWAMTFNTRDGGDYRNQLAGLGAMVGVPAPGKEGEFILIRELKHPAGAKIEDVASLDRIYWIDDKPESVRSLFSVLPQFQKPAYFVAFFPFKLEKRLLELELAYTSSKYRTTDEDRIHETKFDVFRTGDGYDVRVREVFLKR
jgi:hypothetical protein